LQNEWNHYDTIDFLEDVRIVDLIIDDDNISTIEFVLHELRQSATVMEEYTVQQGDNLGAIATRHGTTLNQIYEDNSHITPTTVLRVGDVVRISVPRPYLSVRTVETVTLTEPVPMALEEMSNPGEPRGFMRIIQEGEDGEREVDLRITRINGVQTEPEVEIASRVLKEMKPQITEIGTR
jgi:LysM repeat protein